MNISSLNQVLQFFSTFFLMLIKMLLHFVQFSIEKPCKHQLFINLRFSSCRMRVHQSQGWVIRFALRTCLEEACKQSQQRKRFISNSQTCLLIRRGIMAAGQVAVLVPWLRHVYRELWDHWALSSKSWLWEKTDQAVYRENPSAWISHGAFTGVKEWMRDY